MLRQAGLGVKKKEFSPTTFAFNVLIDQSIGGKIDFRHSSKKRSLSSKDNEPQD
jgi:hypothetical protein